MPLSCTVALCVVTALQEAFTSNVSATVESNLIVPMVERVFDVFATADNAVA